MGPLNHETIRGSLFFLVLTAVGLPVWVVLLFPTRYEEYLWGPVMWAMVIFGWLLLTTGLVIGKRIER
jgi:hypothetical protein